MKVRNRLRGGVVRSSTSRELRATPRPLPSQLAAARRREPVEPPHPTGNLKGAEGGGGRAAAWPARKENLLPAEAALSSASPICALSPRGCSACSGLTHGSGPRDTYLTSPLLSEWVLPGARGAQAIPILLP